MKKIPKRFRTQDKVCKKFQLLGVSRRKQKVTNLQKSGSLRNPGLDIASFYTDFSSKNVTKLLSSPGNFVYICMSNKSHENNHRSYKRLSLHDFIYKYRYYAFLD